MVYEKIIEALRNEYDRCIRLSKILGAEYSEYYAAKARGVNDAICTIHIMHDNEED